MGYVLTVNTHTGALVSNGVYGGLQTGLNTPILGPFGMVDLFAIMGLTGLTAHLVFGVAWGPAGILALVALPVAAGLAMTIQMLQGSPT